jgi:hypothetical protein
MVRWSYIEIRAVNQRQAEVMPTENAKYILTHRGWILNFALLQNTTLRPTAMPLTALSSLDAAAQVILKRKPWRMLKKRYSSI